jgi:hypothetical protein
MLDSINNEQRLYVLTEGKGYSCLGFDVAEKWLQDVLAWLPANMRPKAEGDACIPGTAEHYEFYRRVMDFGAAHAANSKTRCPAQLTPQLIGLEGKRVEVTTPSGDISRFYVGKSTGWLPIHLEIKTRRSSGGGSVYVPEGSTVRIVRAA